MKGINFTDMDIKKLIVIQEVIDGKKNKNLPLKNNYKAKQNQQHNLKEL